jgi:hypothetical protein
LKYYQTWSTDPITDWTLGEVGTTHDPGLYIGISSTAIADVTVLSQGFLSGAYDQATGTEGTTGDFISGTHTSYNGTSPLSGGWIKIDQFTSANPYMVHSGQIVGAATGRSRCIVTQVLVGSGATAGDKDDKTATFQYTEA